ncbi:MAG: DUF4412 domain-containing protein [Bacteroidales bacterium]|nr:DUF4412 domain-containing protein [Bacteroidales bacterium]
MKFFILILNVLIVKLTFSQATKETINTQSSKPFEGFIFFSMEMISDTLYYTYYIKDRMVRMDEFNRCKDCKIPNNYMLFDLNKKTIAVVNPLRKMYMFIETKPYKERTDVDENFKIIKTNNYKYMFGYKCYQWRVRNKNENTEVSYWVAFDNFEFFIDFLKLFNRSEKHAQYFLLIPETKGYFPMLSEERTTLREQKMTLRVINIQRKVLDKSLFQIPKDYKNFEE